MYFDSNKFLKYLKGYFFGLWIMLTTSWMKNVTNDDDDDGDLSIEYPGWILGWDKWRPESLGEWISRWFIVLPLLVIAGILFVMVALIKFSIWLVFLIPALIIGILFNIKLVPAVSNCQD